MKNRYRILALLITGILAVQPIFAEAENSTSFAEDFIVDEIADADEDGDPADPAASDAATSTTSTTEEPVEVKAMYPWMNSNIAGAVTADTPVPDKKDDFYLASNYDWLAAAELAPGHISAGTFEDCQDNIDKALSEIMTDETLEGHDAKLLQGLYDMFLDWDTRNALGVTPYQHHIDAVNEIETLDDLTGYLLSDEGLYYEDSLVGMGIGYDADDSTKYDLEIYPNSLSLSDSAEYESMTGTGQLYYWVYQQTSNLMLPKYGFTEEETADLFEDAYAFEELIAPAIMTVEASNASDALEKTINPVTFEELKELSPNFPLTQIMEKLDYADWNLINLNEPEWLAKLNEIYTEENVPLMKAFIIRNMAVHTVTIADEETFRCYQDISNIANGITESDTDEKIACDFATGTLETCTSKVFAEKYLTPEMRDDITEMISEIIDAYRVMLNEEDWMSEETKACAIRKLDCMKVNAAYPDKWDDTEKISFKTREEGGNLFDAIDALTKYASEQALTYKNGTVDPDIWVGGIAEANAFYNRSENSINIIGGILRAPIYEAEMTREEKLGGIGFVIAHEISHAFDSTGSQFDENGNLNDWWTESDKIAFDEKVAKLIAYYDTFIVLPDGTGYSGTMVQGEAAADMAGIKALLYIASGEENFDYDSFFSAAAKLWRHIATPEDVQMQVTLDEHPLAYLRINVTLAQYQEFVDTYGLTEGDGMYVAPEDRINVW